MKYILPLLAIIFPSTIFAGPFDPTVTDKSVEILGILGNVGNVIVGPANPAIQEVFEKFNWAIVSVSVFILGYITLVSIINTAQEGQVMGRKWSSIWIPLRSMIGILLMVPIANQGYSVIQAVIAWIIIQGVGLADTIWGAILDNLAKGIGATSQVKLFPHEKAELEIKGGILFHQLIKAAVCEETLKLSRSAGFSEAFPKEISDNAYRIGMYTDKQSTGTGVVSIGIRDRNNPQLSKICGSWEIKANVSSAEVTGGVRGGSGWSAVTGAIADVTRFGGFGGTGSTRAASDRLFAAKAQAISALYSLAKAPARQIVAQSKQNFLQDSGLFGDVMHGVGVGIDVATIGLGSLVPPASIAKKVADDNYAIGNKARERYANILSGQVTFSPSSILGAESYAKEGKRLGWAIAGSYYFLLNKAPFKTLLTDAKTQIGQQVSYSDSSNSEALFAFVNDKLKKGFNSLNKIVDEFIAFDSLNLSAAFSFRLDVGIEVPLPIASKIINAISENVNKLILEPFIKFLSFTGLENIDPLFIMVVLGKGIMFAAEQIWGAITVILIGGSLVAGICASTQPLFLSIIAGIAAAGTIIMGMLMAFYGIGVTMGMYIPMIPYIIFTTGVLGWAMLAIEAIVAGPIVALGIISPSQDEMGNIKPALNILSNVFLRPTLMIVGFIFAAKLLVAIIKFVNFGFFQTFMLAFFPGGDSAANIPGASTLGSLAGKGTPPGVMFLIFILIIYTVFILSIVNNIFSFIYVLPDKIMRWIGGATEQVGAEMGRITGETKQSVEKGKAQVEQGMQAVTTKSMERLSSETGKATKKSTE